MIIFKQNDYLLIDVLFLLFISLAIFNGFTKGLIIAVFSFIAYFIGLAAALKLSSVAAQYLSRKDHEPSVWGPVISFVLIFVIVVLLVNLSARAIRSVVKATAMGWIDRLGGMLFFVLIYTFIFSIFIFYASEAGWISDSMKESSRVYAYVFPVAPAMIGMLGRILPVFKDLFEKLELFFENLSTKI